ncbi:MAG TPA: hypothetical protein PKD96_02330, partial [Candidatus Absconditabacterales bacterium]|nr:hypothetical protein [Candidatus Absconditabacterales bacterium]
MNKPVSDYNSRSAIIGSNQIRFGRTLDEMSGFAPSESKKFVENYTRVFFQEKGYKYVNPEGLVPSDHSSILYTNSAVINLISQIKNNSFAGKFFCIQRCLRTQNLTQQNSEIPEYMSLFTMPGIFVEIEEYNSFCGDIIEFLGTLIPLSRFKIAFSNDHEIHKLYRQDSALENMDHPYEYYNRKFGSKTITGEKDTFSDSLTGEGASIMLNSG